MSDQKLLNTVIHKVNPVTGEILNRNKSPEATAQVDSLNFDSPARSLGDGASQGSPQNAASTTHYEPHLVTGEPVTRKGKKDVRIRGVFRMDPRFDPQCTPI